MDQLKKAWDGVNRYLFWIVCLVVAAVALSAGIVNARKLNAARNKLELEINSDIAKVEKVKSTTAETGSDSVKAHPNRYTAQGMGEQIKLAADEALQAWDLRYKSQSPSFVWPKDLLGPATKAFESQPIPERFLPTGKLVNPEEAATATVNADESADSSIEEISTINTQELDKFAQVIHLQMPRIASIIGARWEFNVPEEDRSDTADSQEAGGNVLEARGAAGRSRGKDGVKVEKEVVQWRKADQERWNNLVTNFKAYSRLPTNRPTLPMALYIQQDLWLLEALFKIIKEVNGDADAKDNADIKKIDHIFFGRNALGMSGSIEAPNARLLKQAIDQGKKREVPKPSKALAVTAPAAPVTISPTSRDFLNGRYVNGRFEPLPAATVRTAIGTGKLSNSAELIVAKRIPFRIAFEMDERRIPEFLAACANSPFRFEVRQVRINRHVPGQTVAADGKAVGGESTNSGDAAEAGAGLRGTTIQAPKMVATRTNYDVKVEFYGFVKVYNPVNYRLLQSPADSSGSQTASR